MCWILTKRDARWSSESRACHPRDHFRAPLADTNGAVGGRYACGNGTVITNGSDGNLSQSGLEGPVDSVSAEFGREDFRLQSTRKQWMGNETYYRVLE